MFCPNCGKQVNDNDNFCRYCGSKLVFDEFDDIVKDFDKEFEQMSVEKEEQTNQDIDEEFVLFDVKKHWMSLFWPIVLTPLFFIYFWTVFLNTHSFLSWVIIFVILTPIVYPVLRYNSDKIVITNKFAHIKIGVINPAEIDIPLSELNILDITQSSMGKYCDYGMVSFVSKSQRFDYGYIKEPEMLQYIANEPEKFVKEALEEPVFI